MTDKIDEIEKKVSELGKLFADSPSVAAYRDAIQDHIHASVNDAFSAGKLVHGGWRSRRRMALSFLMEASDYHSDTIVNAAIDILRATPKDSAEDYHGRDLFHRLRRLLVDRYKLLDEVLTLARDTCDHADERDVA